MGRVHMGTEEQVDKVLGGYSPEPKILEQISTLPQQIIETKTVVVEKHIDNSRLEELAKKLENISLTSPIQTETIIEKLVVTDPDNSYVNEKHNELKQYVDFNLSQKFDLVKAMEHQGLMLQYIEDLKNVHQLLDSKVSNIKPVESKYNKHLLYFNIGMVLINVILLIKSVL